MSKQLPSAMGSSFAERAAASRGDKTFTAPESAAPAAVPNSTFAERQAAGRDTTGKQVAEAEDKALSGAESKTRTRKRSS